MPETVIRLFRDENGSVPVLDWLASLKRTNRKAFNKCLYLIDLLAQFGSELRRPRSDFLRDGVYELRTQVGGVNYRVLYGFVGKNIALISHGITKERRVPDRAIDLAVERLNRYRTDPDRYSAIEELPDG